MNTHFYRRYFFARQCIVLIVCFLGYISAYAQEGTLGNTTIFNGAQMTFFGAHSFATGGSGVQPGIIKTIRTAPVGILGYSETATYSGANDANHVDGYVSKTGTAAFTFPIGNGTKLRTASISAPSASATFKAAYWFENPNAATLPAGAPFLIANKGTGVFGVSDKEYWDIDGPSAVDLTLTWDAASGLNALTGGVMGNLAIVGYNSTTNLWENLGGTATGTLTGTGNIVATGVTPDNYSAFTFAAIENITAPDLRPYVIMPLQDITAPDITRPFSVRIRNVRTGTTATETVRLRIYKPTLSSTIVLTGSSTSNWTITNSGLYYTLTTELDIASNPLGITVTAEVTVPVSVPTGVYPLRALIPDLSGGELAGDNVNNEIIIQLYRN